MVKLQRVMIELVLSFLYVSMFCFASSVVLDVKTLNAGEQTFANIFLIVPRIFRFMVNEKFLFIAEKSARFLLV